MATMKMKITTIIIMRTIIINKTIQTISIPTLIIHNITFTIIIKTIHQHCNNSINIALPSPFARGSWKQFINGRLNPLQQLQLLPLLLPLLLLASFPLEMVSQPFIRVISTLPYMTNNRLYKP